MSFGSRCAVGEQRHARRRRARNACATPVPAGRETTCPARTGCAGVVAVAVQQLERAAAAQ